MNVLVITDMQYAFTTGSLANPAAEKIVEPMVDWLSQVANHYDFVIVTRDTHNANYLNTCEGKHLPVVHALEGTKDWEVDSRLVEVLDKNYAGKWNYLNKTSFGYDSWQRYLLNLARILGQTDGTLHVDICGTLTEICVVSNALAIKTAVPECEMRVFAALCAGLTEQTHEAALSVMNSCQIEVVR